MEFFATIRIMDPVSTAIPFPGTLDSIGGKQFSTSDLRFGLFAENPLNYIWSPWRMEYIQNEKNTEECVFCHEIGQEDGPQNLIVYRGQLAFVILNRYPYTSGHLMVVPYVHLPSLEMLDSQTRAEIMELTAKAIRVLRYEYSPQGFNLGVNIGEAAGAGIIDHVHLHVVPRWNGDTNFMSSLGGTRVIPEMLEDSYTRIRKGWYEKLEN
jgi:ATP adenylyltransferase